MLKLRLRLALTIGFLSLPALAMAAEPLLTPARVFLDAAPFPKALMLGLLASALAAGVIAARKLASPSLSGGSAFISGLRLGGPLLGTLGAAYTALHSAIGFANFKPTDLSVMAPGIAEIILIFGLGMLAGSLAVILHWAIEARIDRKVLGA